MHHSNIERFYAFLYARGNIQIVLEEVVPNTSKIKLWDRVEDVHNELGLQEHPYRIFSTHRPLEPAIHRPDREREAV
jgi:hypothetical protein